ncbi:MAG TPA: ornithine carbamoyltransferase [Cytophagales bacterium]|nr:ornithine carbamoyltransferase [Cytophagales bacterium]HAA18178.1 ornithine carbamoyltransferase [Cytophagales bacterium]HAP59772.1 ornithine carbamoyltransferase [Cytophagales bacterium]
MEENNSAESSPRHVISLNDLKPTEIDLIVNRGLTLQAEGKKSHASLDGKVMGMLFKEASTRTRTAFMVGTLRLGGQVVSYGPKDLQENTGETREDTGASLGGMLDGLVVRTSEPIGVLRQLATKAQTPIINGMCAEEHPTQALSDLSTLRQVFGKLEGLRILYVGTGNNTASALALACARIKGVSVEFRTPEGYGLPKSYFSQAQRFAFYNSATVGEQHHMDDLPERVDVVYTSRWGVPQTGPDWMKPFFPFQVNQGLLKKVSGPGTVCMHDLPAQRGYEITSEVFEGPQSICLSQAEMKLYSAMAVLEWCQGCL